VLAKDETQLPKVQSICTMGLNLFRLLTLYLKPVLPKLAIKVEDFLNISPLKWDDQAHPLLDHEIKKFKPLMQRIDAEQIDALQATAQNESY
jgi:methionyl-tRNA synthetase